MIPTNLILVDGLPGSGKSTTAQRLSFHLASLGYEARWLYEHELPHPIYPDDEVDEALTGGLPALVALQEQALHRWQALADSLAGTRQIVILESTFFQIGVGLLVGMLQEEELIRHHTQRILTATAPLNPQLLYLYQDDVPAALHRLIEQRGPGFAAILHHRLSRTPYCLAHGANLEALVGFFQRQRAVTDHLLAHTGLRHLAIENSGREWAHYERQIATFLDLPPWQEPLTPPDALTACVGRYRDNASEDEFHIVADDQNLYLASPTLARLYPRAPGIFAVEGICIEFTFQRNAESAVDRLVCRGNLPGLSLTWLKQRPIVIDAQQAVLSDS